MRFILFAFLFISSALAAQTDTLKNRLPQNGVEADYRVAQLVEKHIEYNQRAKEKGYRVQIFFGADKAKAKEAKSKFLARHSKTTAYEVYEVPNFKIRVGDFRTRLEAYKFQQEILSEFPGAFIVVSDIDMPDIKR